MKKISLLSIALFCALSLWSQSYSGHVYFINEAGKKQPAEAALVFWAAPTPKQTPTVVTYAKEDGSFTIEKGATPFLVASYLGYVNDTLRVASHEQPLEFVLQPSAASLDAVTVVGRQQGNFLSKTAAVKTEVISAAGLCKMACCNLAESFENSASVTVGYSDAVTGARQIRLLGLSGSYTQMLDENRPTMRGILAPFGLNYVPGQWLESIQIAKGTGSVVNGYEAITGQINMEYRKPTTEMPLFVNLFLSHTLRAEANVASSLQLNDRLSTTLLAHVSADFKPHDMDQDGFMDEPLANQYNFANRWLYQAPSGVQLRVGYRALYEDRRSGQMGYEWVKPSQERSYEKWGSNILSKGVNGYVKLGIPLTSGEHDHAIHEEDENHIDPNIAFVVDYTHHRQDSYFGPSNYNAKQTNVFANVIFMSSIGEHHKITAGLSAQWDRYAEDLAKGITRPNQLNPLPMQQFDLGRAELLCGAYAEYTLHIGDKFMGMAGVRGDYHNRYGWSVTPKVNVKYNFTDALIFRASAGKGYRTPQLIADNIGVLSTGRLLQIPYDEQGRVALDREEAWTFGLNLAWTLPIGYDQNATLSFDYFRTQFQKQVIVDQEYGWDHVANSPLQMPYILFYNLDGQSFTNTYQVDLTVMPFNRFTAIATFRYNDSKVNLLGQGLVDRPLTSKYKGVLNLQYVTNRDIWTFDFTAQINGPSRLPNYALANEQVRAVATKDGYSPVYPMLFAQITRKFPGVDVYIGGENLLNYRQKYPILGAQDPYSPGFNATAIWGPLMGIKVYAGMRLTIWK